MTAEGVDVAATYQGRSNAERVVARLSAGDLVALRGTKSGTTGIGELRGAASAVGLRLADVSEAEASEAEAAWLEENPSARLLKAEAETGSVLSSAAEIADVYDSILGVPVSAIVASPSSGKTYGTRGLMEHAYAAGYRIAVLDPKGDHYGIRHAADGEGPGLPFTVIGGLHGDVDLPPNAGAAIGRYVASRDTHVVIDASLLSPSELTRFAADYYETLFAENDGTLLSVIDEAQVIVPQRHGKDTERALRAVGRLVSMGRQRGHKVVLVTQRTQAVDKSVLDLALAFVVMNLVGPSARTRVEEWFKGTAEPEVWARLKPQLTGLPVGEGFIYAPRGVGLAHFRFPEISTFDSMREPEPGEVRTRPKRAGSSSEVSALIAALAGDAAEPKTPDTSAAEAARDAASVPAASTQPRRRSSTAARSSSASASKELAEARAEVARLRAELAETKAELRASVEGTDRAVADAVARAVAEVSARVRAALGDEAIPLPVEADAEVDEAGPAAPETATAEEPPAEAPRERVRLADDSSPMAHKMVAALEGVSPPEASWAQLAGLIGSAGKGGAWDRARTVLRAAPEVEIKGNRVRLLAPPLPSARPLDVALRATLSPSVTALLDAVVASPGTPIEEIADKLGREPSGGSWDRSWSLLKRLGLAARRRGVAELGPVMKAAGERSAAAPTDSAAATPDVAPAKAATRKKRPPLPASADPGTPLGASFVEAAIDAGPIRLTWHQAGAVIGKKATGPWFNKARRELLDGRLVIEDEQKRIVVAAPREAPRKGMVEDVRVHLSDYQRSIFDLLLAEDEPISPERIGEATNHAPTGPYWNMAMKGLRSKGLAVQVNGLWSATETMKELANV